MRTILVVVIAFTLLTLTAEVWAQSGNQGVVKNADSVPSDEKPKAASEGEMPKGAVEAEKSAKAVPVDEVTTKSQKPKAAHQPDFKTWQDWAKTFFADIGFVEAMLTIFTGLMAWATFRISKHSSAIERGIVKLSHAPPGLHFHGQRAYVRIMTNNLGNTPARVTDVILKTEFINQGQTPTGRPDYAGGIRGDGAHGFLAKDDHFGTNFTIDIPSSDWNAIQNQTMTVLLYGYADYIDIFGRRHRAGYGRQYNIAIDDWRLYASAADFSLRNNLPYVANPTYNYDRRMYWWIRLWESMR